MKTELRAVPHHVTPGEVVIEVWAAGVFLATIVGADKPGVRIITKHPLLILESDSAKPRVLEVRIG